MQLTEILLGAMIYLPVQIPEDVWGQADSAYRFPLLRVRVGNTVFDHSSRVQVREATFTLAAKRTRIDFEIVVFDPTMVELARLLRLNAFYGRENNLAVSFGWNFPGGYIPERNGTIESVTQDITPEGFNYTLRGIINYNTVSPPNTELKPMVFGYAKISDVVRIIVTQILGMDENSITIQETPDSPLLWNTFTAQPIAQYLNYLADTATKYLSQGDSNNPERFSSVFDIFGRYHFHTEAYDKERLAKPRVSVRWPYPEPNKPVISLSVSDVEWEKTKLRASDLDPFTGEVITGEESIKTGGAAISIPVKIPPLGSGNLVASISSVAKALSDRDMYADIVLMGNTYIEFGDTINIDVVAPVSSEVGIRHTKIGHLSGKWIIRQAVHNITDAGFVTRLNLQRYFEENKNVVLN